MRTLIKLTPLLIVLSAAGAAGLAATPPAAENPVAPGDLRFRRVYVPEGMKDWSKGNVKYLPVDADEFDRLLRAIQRTPSGGPAQNSAGLVEAQYEARLKAPLLLQGSASLKVSQTVAGAMLVSLDPCNLAIARAQWVTSDGDTAIMGPTADGKLQVLAERSGQLKFDWSLAGQQDAAGDANFVLSLPPSSVSGLRIELPAEFAPTVDRGIVTDEGPADAGLHYWRLALGGRPGCRLRLAKAGSLQARPQPVLASQSATYDISLRGAELAVKLKIEAHREPLPRLTLDLDPSLELIEATAGDLALSWGAVASRAGKPRQVAINLPPSLQEGAVDLRLRAAAPLVTADLWKLPRIMFEGFAYRSSAIRLSLASPLCLDRLETRGCRQTAVAAVKTSAGQQFDFESFAADAAIEIALSQHAVQVQAVSATATHLGQGKMSSRVATDFRTGEGPLFALEADVLPNWTIDSVESQPTDGLDDWRLDRQGKAARLSVRLARPLSSVRPLRLIVSARRLYASPGRNLGIDDLVPLRFAGLAESKRWVSLYASGPNELSLPPGDHLRQADVKDLTAAELDLFAEPPGDFLFRDDAGAAGLTLSLEHRRPAYSAAIRVEAVVGDGVLAENYAFACTPSKSAPIDRAVVHFSGHHPSPLSWSVAGMDASRFSARRWTAQQESSAGLTADEEAWDVVFPNPRPAPVEIRASRKTRLLGPTPVCLASLPDAARQEATLTVRRLGAEVLQFKTHRLQPLPTEAAPLGQMQTVRASYQYDPRTESTPQSEPALVLSTAGSQSSMAWAWDCQIDSRVAADGTGDHLVSYSIQNAGNRQIDLKLPAGILSRDVHVISINGKPAVARSGANSSEDEIAIDLPGDLKFVDLVLRISTRRQPLGTFRRLRPPLPDIGLPVFARHWRLELPPGYAACGFDSDADTAQGESFNLRRCLLGSLGRANDQSIFNPLRRDDWQAALGWQQAEDRRAGPGEEAETPGWAQFQIDAVDDASSVVVVHRATLAAWGWLLFLAVVGIGAWRLCARPLILLLAAAALAIPALLLPPVIAAVFAHGLLGVLFCLVLALVRRRMTAAKSAVATTHAEMPSTLTNIVPFGAPLLAAALLCGIDPAAAAEPAKSAPPTYSVFIPVDEKQQPRRGKYFLPEPFFAELYRRAALQTEKPQGWMISSAVYRAVLANDAGQAGHVVDRLAAEFEIRVFNSAAQVRIPVRRDEVSLEPGQAKLDDRAVQPEWAADGSALLLEIAEPGKYRLELMLRPTVQPGNRPSGFDLAIPRVPTARLEFSVPAGGPRVDFPSALGEIRWEDVQSYWTVDLGPSDRLAANWRSAAPTDAATIDVEQLLWMKIEQGCVLLDARIKAKTAAGPLRRLFVRADPALELLPSTDPALPAVQIRGRNDALQTYELLLSPSAGSATTVDLHFLCNGAASQGTFRIPQIDVVDARLARRSLAVSIDPALEYKLPAARPPDAGPVAEFVNRWGPSDRPPDLAFHLNGNAAEWNLVTAPRRAEISGDESLACSFSAQSAAVQFDALLTAAGGSLFQYRLDVPPGLSVDSVTVLADAANHVAHWLQDKDGHVSVILAAPVSGHHEFHLHGQIRLSDAGKLPLPRIRLEDVHIQNSLVSLYRQPDILIEVAGAAGLADVKATGDDVAQGDLGRPVRSFYRDLAATSPLSVTVRANRPRVQAEQVTRITCEDNLWRTACDFSVQVSQGLLDSIELEVPASWKENLVTSPVMAVTFSDNSDQRASLLLAPPATISREGAFSLSGPPLAATQFAVPNVALKHVEGVKRYVVLPKAIDNRPVAWALRNLRRWEGQETVPSDAVKYEVVGEPWQAVSLPPQRTIATTRVVQADVRYAWQADGRCLGAAFLDLETAAALDCPLQLPEGFELLQLTVDGLPVDALRGAGGTWTVPVTSQASVSRVQLLFFAASALPPAPAVWTRRCAFSAPKLGDLPVERIVWTIAAPSTLQAGLVDGDGVQPPPPPAVNARPGDIVACWQRAVAGLAVVSSATSGTVDAIELDYRPLQAQSWLPRLAGLAGLLAVVGLAAFVLRRHLLGNCFDRRPYLFGLGIGLAWWLWLSPSAVGLLIVLAVLLRQFVPWWKLQRLTPAVRRWALPPERPESL